MEKAVWISYDLGIKGDYDGLFRWIDSHNGKECVNNMAFITFTSQSDLLSELKSDLESSIEIKSSDRIYVVYKDAATGRMKGKFLIGNRKAAPWAGYSPSREVIEDGE
jgi:hypothetical protein